MSGASGAPEPEPEPRRGSARMSGARRAAALGVALVAAAVAFATVALLADGDGHRDPGRAPVAATAPAPTALGGAPARGARVFAAMGCGGCHRLAAAGSSGEIGPDLDQVLPGHTAASLRAFIVHPTQGGLMPDDFGARMTPAQLDALVAFLLAA